MRVKASFFAVLREIVGEKEKMLEFDSPPTIREVLDLLVDRYGRKFEERKGKAGQPF